MHIKIKKSVQKEKLILDKLSYPINIIYPFLTLPQLYEIYVNHRVAGVSIVTWALYAVLSFCVLLWAIADNIKPLMIAQSIWIVVDLSVVAGIILYS